MKENVQSRNAKYSSRIVEAHKVKAKEMSTCIDAEGGRVGSLGCFADGGDAGMASIAGGVCVRILQAKLLSALSSWRIPAAHEASIIRNLTPRSQCMNRIGALESQNMLL
jgi:hypothetical protein